MSDFTLPDLGEGLADARIVSWHVKPAQTINAGEPLVSVETAKAIVDIPAPYTGRVAKLAVQAEDVVNVGEVLLTIEPLSSPTSPVSNEATVKSSLTVESSDNELLEPEKRKNLGIVGSVEYAAESNQESLKRNAQRAKSSSIKEARSPEQQQPTVRAMPAVRVKANELGIDLADITGTGPDQSITMLDLETTLNKIDAEQTHQSTATVSLKPAQKTGTEFAAQQTVRKRMAEVMQASAAQIVPATVNEFADIGDQPADCNLTQLAIEAMVHASTMESTLNAWFDSSAKVPIIKQDVNVAIAVDTPVGLLAPVIKNADQFNSRGLHQSLTDLVARVRAGNATPADLTGATITLSNFGSIGGMHASLIIPPPTVAIVGIGKARDLVTARQGSIAVRRSLPVSLTFDHRAITGGEAARFLNALIDYLQDPSIDHLTNHC